MANVTSPRCLLVLALVLVLLVLLLLLLQTARCHHRGLWNKKVVQLELESMGISTEFVPMSIDCRCGIIEQFRLKLAVICVLTNSAKTRGVYKNNTLIMIRRICCGVGSRAPCL